MKITCLPNPDVPLCVCVHISVCVQCVFPYAYTHTPLSKVIWYNLAVKLFDIIWKTRFSWQGYFSILLLQLLSVPYLLCAASVRKSIPMAISKSSQILVETKVVFLGQFINKKYKFRAICCISRISQSRSDFEPLFYSYRFKCKNWLKSWCTLDFLDSFCDFQHFPSV